MKFCHEHCRFTLWGTWMPEWSGWFGRMVRTEDLSGSLCFGKLLRRRCCCMKRKMMAWSTSKRSKNAAWMYSRVWAWEPQAKGSRTWWRCGNDPANLHARDEGQKLPLHHVQGGQFENEVCPRHHPHQDPQEGSQRDHHAWPRANRLAVQDQARKASFWNLWLKLMTKMVLPLNLSWVIIV